MSCGVSTVITPSSSVPLIQVPVGMCVSGSLNHTSLIRYRLSGDSIIQEKEQDIMLGMTQNGEYYFYGEQEAVYAKVDAKVVRYAGRLAVAYQRCEFGLEQRGNRLCILVIGVLGQWIRKETLSTHSESLIHLPPRP